MNGVVIIELVALEIALRLQRPAAAIDEDRFAKPENRACEVRPVAFPKDHGTGAAIWFHGPLPIC